MVYILILFFLYLLISRTKYRDSRRIYTVLTVVLVLCSCLRPLYAAKDIINYYPGFEMINSRFSWIWEYGFKGWEKGYILLNRLVGMIFGTSSLAFLSFFSCALIIPFAVVFWKKSENPFLSMAIFIATGGFMTLLTALRQMCAYVILLKCDDNIVKKRVVFALFFIAIAFFFHESALVYCAVIVLYLVFYNREINVKTLVLTGGVSALLFFNTPLIFNYVSRFFRVRYEMESSGGLAHTLFSVCVIIFCFIFDKEQINENKSKKMYFCMLLFSAAIQILTLNASVLGRLNKYFYLPSCLLLPDAIENFYKTQSRRSASILDFVFLLVLSFMCIWSFMAYYSSFYGWS